MPRKTSVVEIDCREVWKEITNYIENDLTLRNAGAGRSSLKRVPPLQSGI